MYCSSCGKQMDHIRLRCPACHHMTSAYWLNAFSLVMWLLIVAANYVYLQKLLPVLTYLSAFQGEHLLLPVRIHAALARWVTMYWWVVLLLVVLGFGLFRWKKMMLPGFLKSGRLLASLTSLVMAGTLAGLLTGMTLASIYAPALVNSGIYKSQGVDELGAAVLVRALSEGEAAYRQKNPQIGYTCELKDLLPLMRVPAFRYPWLARPAPLQFPLVNYNVTLSGCSGKPVATYHAVATPVNVYQGRRTFCTDQSGAIRLLEDHWEYSDRDSSNAKRMGKDRANLPDEGDTCLKKGEPAY